MRVIYRLVFLAKVNYRANNLFFLDFLKLDGYIYNIGFFCSIRIVKFERSNIYGAITNTKELTKSNVKVFIRSLISHNLNVMRSV